ncbi:hypothetical protein EVG20_g5626 [Dentipellis fragilis]|uniref:Uncharacterized protein n=1 Tax=Dentipellis fragilis TaxID=205917 RepID=A0A4Y9YUG0_9AGAM|nr:hypothetical protein EVG20_g5626 [Dentipellis fragilis]
MRREEGPRRARILFHERVKRADPTSPHWDCLHIRAATVLTASTASTESTTSALACIHLAPCLVLSLDLEALVLAQAAAQLNLRSVDYFYYGSRILPYVPAMI